MSEENGTVTGEKDVELFDLDGTLDEVEAAPEFVMPANGHHVFGVVACKIKDAKRINITYKLKETLEQTDADELATEPGSLCSEGWQATKTGLEYFKTRAIQLLGKETCAGQSVTAIVAMLDSDEYQQAYDFTAVTKLAKSGEYENLRFSKVALRTI